MGSSVLRRRGGTCQQRKLLHIILKCKNYQGARAFLSHIDDNYGIVVLNEY
jgi:hypothetical protein